MTTANYIDAIHKVEVWDLANLQSNPLNPRGELDPQDNSILELAESIKSHGLIQPLIITPKGVLIAGHRRRLACELAGLERVQVVIRDIGEREQLEIMLIENMQRRDLNSLQIAQGYKKLSDSGLSYREIAAKVGYSVESISKHIGILELPEELHPMFATFELPLGYVKPLLELDSPQKQVELAKRGVAEGWQINEMMSAVNRIKFGNRPVIRISEDERRQQIISDSIDKLAKIRNDLARVLKERTPLVAISKAEDSLVEYMRQHSRK